MQNAIWQFPFKNMGEVMHKANRYSTLGAEKIKHKKISMGSALAHGTWSFVKHYVFKLGFLDGWAGFVIALGNFEGTFYRYAKAVYHTAACIKCHGDVANAPEDVINRYGKLNGFGFND